MLLRFTVNVSLEKKHLQSNQERISYALCNVRKVTNWIYNQSIVWWYVLYDVDPVNLGRISRSLIELFRTVMKNNTGTCIKTIIRTHIVANHEKRVTIQLQSFISLNRAISWRNCWMTSLHLVIVSLVLYFTLPFHTMCPRNEWSFSITERKNIVIYI